MRDRTHHTRPDGTAIDPVRDLAEFVQAVPMSPPEPEPPQSPPAATAPATAAAPAPTPAPAPASASTTAPAPDEFSGKSPDEIIAIARQERQRAQDLERQSQQSRAELEQQRINEAARRAVEQQQLQQQQQHTPAAPAPPREDPRWKQVDELWFSDPAQARGLMKQIQDEEQSQRLERERSRIKQEVFDELQTKSNRQQGEHAYNAAINSLRNAGVPESQLADPNRLTAVYTVITRRPTANAPNPYYDNGGPLNPNVIAQAWHDLFGAGAAPMAASAPASAPAPVSTPAAAPVPATPPGSSRPAPAATVSTQRATPIPADQRRDIEHLADVFGYDKDKLLERRRARIARQEGKS